MDLLRPLVAMAATLIPAVAQAKPETATDRWTPALSMRYRAIQGTSIAPDGSRVAYVVRTPIMTTEKSEYRSQVWVARADGSAAAQFTRGEKSAGSPSFSPDGRWLAFTTSRSGGAKPAADGDRPNSQVWILPLGGGEAWQLTEAPAGVGSYRWSGDSKRIAFSMRDDATAAEKARKQEKRDVILVDQAFKYAHLYVVDVDPAAGEPAEALRLTAGEFHVSSFDWSPGGDRIVFAHQADPRINTARLSGDLATVTVPPPGADVEPEVTQLVSGAGVESSPRWSPDGRWIVYVSTGAQPEPIGLGDLYVVPAAGGESRALARTHNRSPSIVAWAGDSESIYLLETLGTTRHVVAVPLNGDRIERLTNGPGVVGSVSMTPSGDRLAFTWQTTDQPVDLFVSATESFSPKQVTDLHDGVPRPKLGRTELLAWTAPDGTPVEGLLTYPVEYRSGQRYPIILNVHGGPAGVYTQSFTGAPGIYMLQYFAQEGFAILRPNPRGSTGYGKEFRFANFRDWGYGDLSDLLAGVDRAIQLGVAEPDRQFLMGWSYGGYMTSFAVAQTDRFRVASMGAGLPNLVSMVTTTDIGDYLVAHMGAELWDDYATYEKHSAIYHIANVTTPTQVIHGQNDLRVPFTQGQEFYRALQRRGVATEMVVYPRTPHGPREPKFTMDVSERILTWFARHLPKRGSGGPRE